MNPKVWRPSFVIEPTSRRHRRPRRAVLTSQLIIRLIPAMSLDVFSLLTLGHSPSTSAFSAYKSSNPVQLQLSDESQAGSASPVHVHKVARLDSDSDSASASRSRAGEAAATVTASTRKRGVAQVKITGPACEYWWLLPRFATSSFVPQMFWRLNKLRKL